MDPALSSLRAEVDAVDAELIALLARRREVVARLFALKDARALPRLDAAREAALLADRRARAEALGLPGDDVEAVFRAALRMSHALGR